ncbi:hypothetical protein SAMN05444722_0636 [Rhodovulum sp. ES.010]|uniref:N(2)-fixation sustaining protein CowN n=1 Tax=Rhodovulum sp. ES.010 TaxID=1882821 RepID=UPI000929AA63|nr:N(2)-fixation sustaining protein CowN [Rhodovulum sp. ES.010]SIO15534.1 hypothetical protein SAMN05444722_0636 [Rhodovulum sp. ES.010]
MQDQAADRYVSFVGIGCDGKADRLMAMLAAGMQESDSRWVGYFTQKLAEKVRMEDDNLRFVGAQVNTLAAFFEEVGDDVAQALLRDFEETCC